jgi:hypothetical protein
MPPPEADYAQWKVAPRLKQDIDHANHVFYGKKGKDWKFETYRICWDAFTTTGGKNSPYPSSPLFKPVLS